LVTKGFGCSFLIPFSILIFLSMSTSPGNSAESAPFSLYPYISNPNSQPYMTSPKRVASQSIDSVPLSSWMFRDFLPHFSNLDYGLFYEFSSKGYTRSLLYSDLYLPLLETCNDVFFTQIHYGYNGFTNGSTYENGSASYRTDLSIGTGYRILFEGPSIMALGFNGFWDASQIYGSWWNSWGVGLEMAASIVENDLLDFTANQYGNQFQNMQYVYDIWRKGNVNFDLEAGYSHGLADGSLDVRCKYNAYQFTIGDNQTINGSKGGVEATTGDGLLKVAWEIGYDKDKGTYNTIAASMNVGLQLEAILCGQMPFAMPHSIFMSPERNPRRILTQKVRRNTNLPDKVVTSGAKGLVAPYFEVTMNGPCDTDKFAGCVSNYTTNSASSGTWLVTLGLNIPGDEWGARPNPSYTIRLLGDTGSVTFPLVVTVTPTVADILDYLRVSALDQSWQIPVQVTMTSPQDTSKTIPPDGVPSGSQNSPEIGYFNPTAPGAGLRGNIIISAPGVQTLTIDIISTN
jgi:hypothetical protein